MINTKFNAISNWIEPSHCAWNGPENALHKWEKNEKKGNDRPAKVVLTSFAINLMKAQPMNKVKRSYFDPQHNSHPVNRVSYICWNLSARERYSVRKKSHLIWHVFPYRSFVPSFPSFTQCSYIRNCLYATDSVKSNFLSFSFSLGFFSVGIVLSSALFHKSIISHDMQYVTEKYYHRLQKRDKSEAVFLIWAFFSIFIQCRRVIVFHFVNEIVCRCLCLANWVQFKLDFRGKTHSKTVQAKQQKKNVKPPKQKLRWKSAAYIAFMCCCACL